MQESVGPFPNILLLLGKAETWIKELKPEFKTQSWSKEAGDRDKAKHEGGVPGGDLAGTLPGELHLRGKSPLAQLRGSFISQEEDGECSLSVL